MEWTVCSFDSIPDPNWQKTFIFFFGGGDTLVAKTSLETMGRSISIEGIFGYYQAAWKPWEFKDQGWKSWIYGEGNNRNSFTSLLRQLCRERTGNVTMFRKPWNCPTNIKAIPLRKKEKGVGEARICAEYPEMVGKGDWVFDLDSFLVVSFLC